MSDQAERLRELAERRLSTDEWRSYVDAPISEREREEITSLIRWFQRRYPTPLDRVCSSRHAFRQASQRVRAKTK
jgi:hypothetical protein